MKKILFLLFLNLLFSNAVFAEDYSTYCKSEVPNKTVAGVLSSAVGYNLVARNVAEGQIEKEIKRYLNSDVDVKIDSFYGTTPSQGQFKNISVTSKSLVYQGFHLSDLNVQSVCDYNHVSLDDGKIKFHENMVLKYSTKITQKDLNETVNSSSYKKLIDKMNSDKLVSSLFKIKTSNIEIKDNRIALNYTVEPFVGINVMKNLIKPIKLNLVGDLAVKDGAIELCNLDLNSKKIDHLPSSIVSLLNPLTYNIQVSKEKDSELKLENVKIANNEILIDGHVLILKD